VIVVIAGQILTNKFDRTATIPGLEFLRDPQIHFGVVPIQGTGIKPDHCPDIIDTQIDLHCLRCPETPRCESVSLQSPSHTCQDHIAQAPRHLHSRMHS